MHVYSSTQPLHNPLSLPTNWRFTAHLAPISEPSRAPLDEGPPQPRLPRLSGLQMPPLRQLPTYSLPPGKDAIGPGALRTRLLQMLHPSVAPRTAAG